MLEWANFFIVLLCAVILAIGAVTSLVDSYSGGPAGFLLFGCLSAFVFWVAFSVAPFSVSVTLL